MSTEEKSVYNKICCIFVKLKLLVMSKNLNIGKRTFSGNATPVSSALGRILISSKDSKNISRSLRAIVKGTEKEISVKISKETVIKINESVSLAK